MRKPKRNDFVKVKHFIYRWEKKDELRIKAENNGVGYSEHIYKTTGRKNPDRGFEYVYCGSTGRR
jgi:hypothetical protein